MSPFNGVNYKSVKFKEIIDDLQSYVNSVLPRKCNVFTEFASNILREPMPFNHRRVESQTTSMKI